MTFREVAVATELADEAGLLVLVDDRLCAVLVRLNGDFYGEAHGHWHLEAGFGAVAGQPESFADLAAAARWIAGRVGVRADGAVDAIA